MKLNVTHNAEDLAERLRAISHRLVRDQDDILQDIGDLAATNVRREAAGRPGPNAPTGDYQSSIGPADPRIDGAGNGYIEIGTNKAQGFRLEYGFTGMDSAGRVYDQPPYPHFGPGIEETEHEAERMLLVWLRARYRP